MLMYVTAGLCLYPSEVVVNYFVLLCVDNGKNCFTKVADVV